MPKLGQGQSAEPKQCGSCQYFRHRQEEYDTHGICSFKLPPWALMRGDFPGDMNNEVDPRTVQDTDGCSLYVAKNLAGKPVEFIQSRIWNAGNPSR
jgi:hypothetical protein